MSVLRPSDTNVPIHNNDIAEDEQRNRNPPNSQHHNQQRQQHHQSQQPHTHHHQQPPPLSHLNASSSMRAQTPDENPWLFTAEEVKETPSRLQDVPESVEKLVVAKSARFIQECGNELHVPQLTISVATKFFQRFFMLESMLVHKPPLVAAACLFLSCKVQETLKRLRDVIFWTVKVRTRHTEDYPDGMDMTESAPGYNDEKNNILDKEREVLRVLNFDLNVDHPYRHLWQLTRSYIGHGDIQKTVTQAAWNFVNDSFRTYMPVRFDPKEIATAAMFLSAKLHRFELPDGTKRDKATGKRLLAWHELFHVDLGRIEEICHLMLDMYDVQESSMAAETVTEGPKILESLPSQGPSPKRRKIEAELNA